MFGAILGNSLFSV